MRWLWSLLLLPCLAAADDFVCGDATHLTRYLPSVDPTTVTDGTCTAVAEANLPAQRTLLQTIPRRYLKVVNGAAVEMTQGEKDAVDALLATQQAALQAFRDEIATDDLCGAAAMADINTRLTTIRANLQTAIDAITNIATAKTALGQMADTLMQIDQRIARCLLATRRAR
jgi:hypothetical protein